MERDSNRAVAIKFAKVATTVVMGIIVLSMAMCSFKVVDPGHRGVRVTLGTTENESLPPGMYWANPFTTHIHEMNVQTLGWSGQTTAQTNDTQTATVDFVLNYNLKPDAAHIVYQGVGEDWSSTLISQVVLDQVRSVIGKHDAIKLAGEWNDASRELEGRIREALAPKNIMVTGFQLTNLTYTPEFHRSIEQKVIAQQKAIEEQNRTIQVEQQAKQVVIRAQAEAESMRIRAQALESNKQLVSWEAVQKWNGVLPVYVLSGAVPFIGAPQEGK